MENKVNVKRLFDYAHTLFKELNIKYNKDKYIVFCVFMQALKQSNNLDIAYCNTIQSLS